MEKCVLLCILALNTVASLIAKTFSIVTQTRIIKKFQHGRRLDMVTIESEVKWTEEQYETFENNPLKKQTKKKKKIVFVGARVHPGETPSSYVCQGMINFLLSDNPVAKILRHFVTFKFIPMLNPDGVFVGNYRTCILGQDLNRCWQEKSIHAYPTLAAVKSVTETLSSDKDEEIDMYLDLHAHTGLLGAFVYGNSYTDVYRFQRHTLFPKHLSYCAPDFSLEHTAYNKDKNKQGTSRRFLAGFLNEKVNCYTLEVSFHGYEVQKGNSTTIHVYNEEEYLRLGESICHSLLDYYCATKYIPPDDVPKAVRESCCKGSRAKMVSNGNNRSPHRAASNTALNEKKVGPQPTTSKNKVKTKAVASKQSNEQKQSSNQKAIAAKNI